MAGQFTESQLSNNFLKSKGKFKICFTCAKYTDLSFLTTDEILKVWLD